jgi:hypothetical protein
MMQKSDEFAARFALNKTSLFLETFVDIFFDPVNMLSCSCMATSLEDERVNRPERRFTLVSSRPQEIQSILDYLPCDQERGAQCDTITTDFNLFAALLKVNDDV